MDERVGTRPAFEKNRMSLSEYRKMTKSYDFSSKTRQPFESINPCSEKSTLHVPERPIGVFSAKTDNRNHSLEIDSALLQIPSAARPSESQYSYSPTKICDQSEATQSKGWFGSARSSIKSRDRITVHNAPDFAPSASFLRPTSTIDDDLVNVSVQEMFVEDFEA